VNQTVTVFATTAAERSCPTLCWTGAGCSSPDRFPPAAQHGCCWSQHAFAQLFAAVWHLPPLEAMDGPAAMLRSIARTASNFVMRDGSIE
jgi:hypothetical protein